MSTKNVAVSILPVLLHPLSRPIEVKDVSIVSVNEDCLAYSRFLDSDRKPDYPNMRERFLSPRD